MRLENIGKIVTGNTPSTSHAQNYASKDICFAKPSDILDGTITYLNNSEFYISEYARAKARILPPQSVLVTCIGIIGKVAINNVECAINQQINAIIPDDSKCFAEYLAYAMQNKQLELQNLANAPVVPILNKTQFSKIEIKIPILTEQTKVINKLNVLTNLITIRKKQLTKLDELVKSRFVEMFGTIHDNKFGFDVVTLQDVSAPIKDGTHQTPTYTDDSENGYKFLSSKDVTTGKIDWSHLKYIPEELHQELYAHVAPRKGDILLAKNGTTGIAAVVDRDEVFDIYVSLALIRPIGIHTTYLWAAINAAETKQQFDASLKGIGVPNLHLGEIKKARIVLPPMALQEQFAAFVAQVDKSKLAVKQSLEKLETLKKSLMQQYFG